MHDAAPSVRLPSDGLNAASSMVFSRSSGLVSQLPGGDSCPFSIPDHEVIRLIASGAYGEVWLARNVVGTLRAVKIVRRDRHETAESFEREFNGLQKFEPVSRSHEGLVDILTLGLLADDAGFYYVMELADDTGASTYNPKTLRAELKSRGALPADEVVALGVKLTSALAHLHDHGLLHRDVKPSNILFIGGEPKLADAGLVAPVDDARSLVGTTGYIAPEGPGTAQADLYALGKVLYEAAFGKDRREYPALPADVASRSDHARILDLNAILLKACATNPRERYLSAKAMLGELELLQRGNSIRQKHLCDRLRVIGSRACLVVAFASVVGLITFNLFTNNANTSFQDVQSPIARVNKLVADGDVCLLSSTPDRLQQGLAFFEEALKLDPNFVPARFGTFGICVAKGDLEGVRSNAHELIQLDGNSAEAQIALAYQFWVDWRFAEALNAARKSVESRAYTRRAKVRAHLGYGFQLLQTAQPEAALAQYRIAEEIAAKLGLSDPTLEHHLGHPYLAQRNFAEALKHYSRSVELEPRHVHGYYWKAATYEEMEQFENAVQEFRKVLLLGSDKSVTEQMCNELHEAAGGGKKAYWQKRLQFALKGSEPDLYDIATIYARLDEPERAYEYLTKACQQRSFTQNLMFDLCWNHNDEKFKKIAKGIGIMQ